MSITKRELSRQNYGQGALLERVIDRLKITSPLWKWKGGDKEDPFTISWADESEALQEFCLFTKRELYPLLGPLFKVGPFAKYTEESILDVLIYMAVNGITSENGARTFTEECKRKCPSPRTIRYRLGKMEFSEVESTFFEANSKLLSFFQKRKKLKHRVLLSIDPTHTPCYGRRRKYACGMGRERGTNFGYKFSVCVVSEAGVRVTLHTVSMTQFDSNEAMLEKLIEEARKYVEIELVLLDREFFNEPCIEKLKALHVDYLMPAKKNRAELLKSLRAPCRAEVPLSSIQVPVIAVKDPKNPKKTLYYCTNAPIPDKLLEKVIKIYKKRWTVENAVKTQKLFLAKTYSVNFTIRFFLWTLATLLYNAWVLCNVCAFTNLKLDPAKEERPLITAFRFGTKMKTTFLSSFYKSEPLPLAALVNQYFLRNTPHERIIPHLMLNA